MKYVNLDNLIATVLVFISMLFFQIFLSIDLLAPFWHTFNDFKVTDVGLRELRAEGKSRADTRIVLINTKGLSNLGIAKLLSYLNGKEPKVIGMENILKKSSYPQHDRLLAMVLSETENLVTAENLTGYDEINREFTEKITSDSIFGEINPAFYNLLIGKDKRTTTVRDFVPAASVNGTLDTSFSLAVLAKYSPSAAGDFFDRGNDVESIYYKGNFTKFFFAEAIDILQENIKINFKDKIILLGNLQPAGGSFVLEDIYFTPLNDVSSGRTFPDMYGIVIHANIISMMLDREYFTYLPSFIAFIIAFIICFIDMIIYSYISHYKQDLYEISALFIFVIESILILIATVYLHHNFNFEAELTIALYAIVLSGFAFEGYKYSLKPFVKNIYSRLYSRLRSKSLF